MAQIGNERFEIIGHLPVVDEGGQRAVAVGEAFLIRRSADSMVFVALIGGLAHVADGEPQIAGGASGGFDCGIRRIDGQPGFLDDRVGGSAVVAFRLSVVDLRFAKVACRFCRFS